MVNISAIILAKNEEENIKECLKSLAWCDEIIVILDNSTDKTNEIAKSFGARIFVQPLNNNFSSQRNFGLEKSFGKWILFIDADERVSHNLKQEILAKIHKEGNIAGFYIYRTEIFLGKELKHGETSAVKLLRLAKKGEGNWERNVHEIWKINGQTQNLSFPILHYSHKSISGFLGKINFYTTLNANFLFAQNKKSALWEIIFYPKAKFLYNYLIKLGFLDGIYGFVFAILMSFHSFLTRAKLYMLWKSKRK